MRSGMQGGFAFITVLLLVMMVGAGLAVTGVVWRFQQRRQDELALLDYGNQYKRAISLYYNSSRNGVPQYPSSLSDLLQDPRYPYPRRYLRKLYSDPITRGSWGEVRSNDGGIAGVYSISESVPIRSALFGVLKYEQYKFIAN